MAASSSDMFQKVGRSTATTLSAPGYTIGNTTINVASTANWGDSTGVTFAIDEVDSDGARIAGTYNVFRGVVSSATQVSDLEYVGGDANRDYSAGATTRVYVTVSSYRDNRLIDGILVHADQDGTLKAGAVDNAAVLANDVVETAKLADGAVTTAKIADGAVTPAKLSPTYVETIGTTNRTFTTSWAATGESITLAAGTWVVSYKLSYSIALSALSQGLITTLSTSTSSSNNIAKFLEVSYAINQASGIKELGSVHSATGVYVAASSTTLYLMAQTQNTTSGTILAANYPILLTAFRIG